MHALGDSFGAAMRHARPHANSVMMAPLRKHRLVNRQCVITVDSNMIVSSIYVYMPEMHVRPSTNVMMMMAMMMHRNQVCSYYIRAA